MDGVGLTLRPAVPQASATRRMTRAQCARPASCADVPCRQPQSRSMCVLIHRDLHRDEAAKPRGPWPWRSFGRQRRGKMNNRERVVRRSEHHVATPLTPRYCTQREAVQFMAGGDLTRCLPLERASMLGVQAGTMARESVRDSPRQRVTHARYSARVRGTRRYDAPSIHSGVRSDRGYVRAWRRASGGQPAQAFGPQGTGTGETSMSTLPIAPFSTAACASAACSRE
jgi:hypothetical protein